MGCTMSPEDGEDLVFAQMEKCIGSVMNLTVENPCIAKVDFPEKFITSNMNYGKETVLNVVNQRKSLLISTEEMTALLVNGGQLVLVLPEYNTELVIFQELDVLNSLVMVVSLMEAVTAKKTELASNMVVNCGTHDKSDNVVSQEQHVGAWGGKCTCPDGMVYYVGDISGSGCTEFACVNGIADDVCYGFTDNAWSHKEVVCALGEDDPNMVELNAPNTGGWGATCRCPNGSEYKVADIKGSGCEGFACYGGEVVSECYTEDGEWSYKSVTCGEN